MPSEGRQECGRFLVSDGERRVATCLGVSWMASELPQIIDQAEMVSGIVVASRTLLMCRQTTPWQ